MAREKLGAQNLSEVPSGELTRDEIRQVDPRNLLASKENERIFFSVREIVVILGIGTDYDKRDFREDSLSLPTSLEELDVDASILGRPNIQEKWKKLMELAQSMYIDAQDGAKPGGVLEVMRDVNGEKLIISKGHRRQLGAIIADVKVWISIVENVKSKLKRAKQRAAENLQHDDLDLVETVSLYENILDGLKEEARPATQVEANKVINKSKGWISAIHRATTTPHIRDAIDRGVLVSLRQLQDILSLPEAMQKAKLRELGDTFDAETEQREEAPKKRKQTSIKLGGTKNMKFMSRLLNHALKDPDIKEYREDILDGVNLKSLEVEEMERVWRMILETVNASAKK